MSRGHYCIFLPKYHPELNFIERYWSRVKWYARQKCDQTIKGPLIGRGVADMAAVGALGDDDDD